jgi:hypothetical protein
LFVQKVEDIALRIPPIAPDLQCEDVYEIFSRDPDLLSVAVTHNGRPVGLIAEEMEARASRYI